MSDYTPGPWELGLRGHGNEAEPTWIVRGTVPPDHKEFPARQVVCWVQYEKDAKLIASAPELLDALEGIALYCSDTLSGREEGVEDREWFLQGLRELRSRARAAIAKAKGGQG